MTRRAGRPRRPGAVHLNAAQRAITGASRLPAADVQQTAQGIRLALQEFTQGRMCPEHWRSMVDALNVAEQLAELNICSDWSSKQHILNGQRVLANVRQRREASSGGSWTLRGPEITTLRDALERHCIQLTFASYREYETSIEAVRIKHAQYLAGNAPAHAIILTGDIR